MKSPARFGRRCGVLHGAGVPTGLLVDFFYNSEMAIVIYMA